MKKLFKYLLICFLNLSLSCNFVYSQDIINPQINASALTSGTLAAARGGAGTINGALAGNGSGVVSQAACANLSNGATGCSTTVGTAATAATGTTGHALPFLDVSNVWSGIQTFGSVNFGANGGNSGIFNLNGSTSGVTTVSVSATGVLAFSNIQSSGSALAYLCYNTGTGAISSDASSTCLVSSLRFKHDIKPLTDNVAVLAKFNPIKFVYNDQTSIKGEQEGLSAESVAAADPTLVIFDNNGLPLKVKYIALIGRLVGAIQEQQREINTIKTKIRHSKIRHGR